VQRLGQIGDQFFQHVKDKPVLDLLQVVQDQQEAAFRTPHLQDVIAERRADDLAGGKLSRSQDAFDVLAQVCLYLLQGGNEIGKETPGVIIRAIQRQPGDWAIQHIHPRADARRLSKSGRRRYESELATGGQAFIQSLDKVRALDLFGRQGWTMQFCFQQAGFHDTPHLQDGSGDTMKAARPVPLLTLYHSSILGAIIDVPSSMIRVKRKPNSANQSQPWPNQIPR
jgi:hypothetical protein